VRVVYQPCAHRSQHPLAESAGAPAADDDHGGILGQIDQRRDDRTDDAFAFHRHRTQLQQHAIDDVLSFVQDLVPA
jgi:hypothetical protein